MTKHGRWRFIRPGEVVGPGRPRHPGDHRRHDDDHDHHDHPAVGVLAAGDDARRVPGGGQHQHREEPARLQRADALQRVGVPARSAAGRGPARRAGDAAARAGRSRRRDRPRPARRRGRRPLPPTAAAGWPAWRPLPVAGFRPAPRGPGRRRREGLRLRHERRRGRSPASGCAGIPAPGGGADGPWTAGFARAGSGGAMGTPPGSAISAPGGSPAKASSSAVGSSSASSKAGSTVSGLAPGGGPKGRRAVGRAGDAAGGRGRRGRRGRRRARDHEGLHARAARVGHQGEVDSQALEARRGPSRWGCARGGSA